MEKILVVAAHPDDEIIGVGGTVRKLVNEGKEAYCIILAEGMTSRTQEMQNELNHSPAELKKDAERAAEIIGYRWVKTFNLPDNSMDSVARLNIIHLIESTINEIKPDTVFTHFGGDLNIDHQITFESVLTACRPMKGTSVKQLFCFETLSSTEWSFGNIKNAFSPNYFYDISDTLEDKCNAMLVYESELREYPHPRSICGLKTNASRWGMVVGKNAVEAFECIFKINE